MIQESRGNVFCIKHGGPLSECPEECPAKQGARPANQVDSKNVWAKDSRLPMTDEQAVARAQVDAAVRIARDRQKADLARLAKVRAEQEERLAKLRQDEAVRLAQLKKDQEARLAQLKEDEAIRIAKSKKELLEDDTDDDK